MTFHVPSGSKPVLGELYEKLESAMSDSIVYFIKPSILNGEIACVVSVL